MGKSYLNGRIHPNPGPGCWRLHDIELNRGSTTDRSEPSDSEEFLTGIVEIEPGSPGDPGSEPVVQINIELCWNLALETLYHPIVPERIRLRIGNMGKAVLVSGQAYQDPKDALNEFVSNAADEYAEASMRGERIRIVLRRRGRYPVIAVEDAGRGMDAERLRKVAGNLFNSSKVSDSMTIGEKAIGILAFQQLGGRCDIVTRPPGSPTTLAVRLERGSPRAELELNERRRARDVSGTTVYISDLDPDVLRVLTVRKVVDYLRRRRGHALARGDYQIEVIEGRHSELVTPEEPDGVRLDIPARSTLWGRMEFRLYVAARPDRRRRVAMVGAGGTTIIDDIAEIEELDHDPWSSDQVSGLVAFEALRQTAGRRAVLRDRDAFPVFLDAVRSIEPAVARTLERVAREVDVDVASRLNDAVRRIFGRVLKELADLENPMRTAIGSQPGQGALLQLAPVEGGMRQEEAATEARGSRPGIHSITSCSRRTGTRRTSRWSRPRRRRRGRSGSRTSRRCFPIPLPTAFGAGSIRTRASSTTTTATRTTCSRRPTSRRCWTTSPPSWRRSMSSTTTRAPPPTSWPRRW
jgi:histidine kinase/DNA gyrase B/HSP90-like ATPase